MQDSVILAAAEGMPSFDRAAIMAHAWKLYRRDWANARPANAQADASPFPLLQVRMDDREMEGR